MMVSVIPNLIRNPVFPIWFAAFKGMKYLRLLERSFIPMIAVFEYPDQF